MITFVAVFFYLWAGYGAYRLEAKLHPPVRRHIYAEQEDQYTMWNGEPLSHVLLACVLIWPVVLSVELGLTIGRNITNYLEKIAASVIVQPEQEQKSDSYLEEGQQEVEEYLKIK